MNPTYLLNGKVLPWTGLTQPICTPDKSGTSLPFGEAPLMGEKDALAALDAASKAWNRGRGEWPSTPPTERIKAMRVFAALMEISRNKVVDLLVAEISKPRKDAEAEFDRTVDYIQATCKAYEELLEKGNHLDGTAGILSKTGRSPLGVTLCMGPFNYPLNETYTTLIPALIMGNTVIVKPAKYGILLHEPLHAAFANCFPKGAVNFIYGDGATIVNPLMASGKIDVLAFIGTSRVASILKKQHPQPHRLRCILGLDAKNPAIVLPDADLDLAASEILKGALTFNGQRCTALKLIFAHESIAAELGRKIAAGADRLKCGDPDEEGVTITPLAEENKTQWLEKLVDDATSKGATILTKHGGTQTPTLFHPVVLGNVPPNADIYTQEQFGPIVPITTYKNPEEFLDFVDQSNFGQQASIFGKDPQIIKNLCQGLANQVCRININTQCQRGPDHLPFTGRKDSAEGTLSVSDALRCFSFRNVSATQFTGDAKVILAVN